MAVTQQDKVNPNLDTSKTACQVTKANEHFKSIKKEKMHHFQKNDRLTAIFSTAKTKARRQWKSIF